MSARVHPKPSTVPPAPDETRRPSILPTAFAVRTVPELKVIGFSGYTSMAQAATRGIAREFDRAAIAAERIAQSSTQVASADQVRLSPEAVAAARGGGSPEVSGMETAMVDLRVAKYSAAANIRVLQTADEVAREVTSLVK